MLFFLQKGTASSLMIGAARPLGQVSEVMTWITTAGRAAAVVEI